MSRAVATRGSVWGELPAVWGEQGRLRTNCELPACFGREGLLGTKAPVTAEVKTCRQLRRHFYPPFSFQKSFVCLIFTQRITSRYFFVVVNFSKFFIIGLSEHATFFSLAFLRHGSGFQMYFYALELCRPSARGSSFCMLN